MHLFFLLAMLTTNPPTTKPKLIYVGDPMCSWCYGLAPELDAVVQYFGDKVDVQLVMGGLRPYNQEKLSDLKSFLTQHWEEVHTASKQPFDYTILDSQTITYDTEPPCRAVAVVRDMDASKTLEFFKKVQSTFYKDGKNMHLVDSYTCLVEDLGMDATAFAENFSSEFYKSKVREDFQTAAELGVRGFPTLLMQIGDKTITLTNGYAKADQIIKKVERNL